MYLPDMPNIHWRPDEATILGKSGNTINPQQVEYIRNLIRSLEAMYNVIANVVNYNASNVVSLLASETVNLQNGDGKSDIYTVPAGKSMVVVYVVIRNPTASLAGGTDFDFGDGANANTWKNAVDLSSMVATTDYMMIPGYGEDWDNIGPVKYTVFDAGDVFGVKPVTGAVADADATAELFGHLF